MQRCGVRNDGLQGPPTRGFGAGAAPPNQLPSTLPSMNMSFEAAKMRGLKQTVTFNVEEEIVTRHSFGATSRTDGACHRIKK